MKVISNIRTDSSIPSTCAVMDWLKEHNYPECSSTNVRCVNGEYGGMISSHSPELEHDSFKHDVMKEGKYYNGMYRLYCYGAWHFYMPEVDKFYFMTF